MSLETFSTFYTFPRLDDTNRYFPFSEGGGQLNATLDVGSFTITELMGRVKAKLDFAGGLVYTVSFNRITRKVTISATGVFELLVATGSNASSSIFSDLGFTGADRTGGSSYTGNIDAGSFYSPQFELQSFIDKNAFQKYVDPVVRESASGIPEVVRFGVNKFYSFNIPFISSNSIGDGMIIINNPSGLADAISFMEFIVTKAPFEFMKDISNPNDFDTVILESTQISDKGTDFKLNELFSQGLPGVYETGEIVLRVIE